MPQPPELIFPATIEVLIDALQAAYGITKQRAISTVYQLMELDVLAEEGLKADFLSGVVRPTLSMDEFWELVHQIATEFNAEHPIGALHLEPSSTDSTPVGDVQLVVTLPPGMDAQAFDSIRPMRDAFVDLIANTKYQIKIASPYIDAPGLIYLTSALEHLRHNQIRMQLLTRIDDRTAPQARHIQALLDLYKMLGPLVEVRSYSHQIRSAQGFSLNWGGLHAKLILADGERLYLGSGEPRDNALSRNFEIGVVLTHSALVNTVNQLFDAVWVVSDAITFDYCRSFIY